MAQQAWQFRSCSLIFHSNAFYVGAGCRMEMCFSDVQSEMPFLQSSVTLSRLLLAFIFARSL